MSEKEPRHAKFRKHFLANAGKPDEPKWLIRNILQFLASIIILPLFRVRVTGAENIPQGPCLLSPNHVSYADGIIIFALTRRFKMPLRLLAKRDLWQSKFFAWVLNSVGVLPVSQGSADLEALKSATRAIKAGDSMAIFPEGTRIRTHRQELEDNQALGEAFGGAAWLAIRNNVPVVPVGIAGTERIRPDGMKLIRFPRVLVHYGTALVPDEVVPKSEYDKKERISKLTELIMDGLAQSLERAQKENAER
jgi:1-acyl-sn-glycerol-3-phosphate acyltransferase